MNDSQNSERKLQELALLKERRIRKAVSDTFFWLTSCTKTEDEQDSENPLKPFPAYEHFRILLNAMSDPDPGCSTIFLEKSRTMMQTWLTCGWCAHKGFNRPYTGVVFQSKDEDRAIHCVYCVRALWQHTDLEIQAKWPLAKPLIKQQYNCLTMANGSWFKGIPGDPDKIRYEHPTVVVFDEACFIPMFEASYSVAAATRCPKLISLSSANPGPFRDATAKAKPGPFRQKWLR